MSWGEGSSAPLSLLFYLHLKMIPKIIHQVWLNDEQAVPLKYVSHITSVVSSNPHWKHILWDLNKIKAFKFRTPKRFEELNTWAHKADILRYELVHRFGGVYIDCDFEIHKPLDAIIELEEVVAKGAFVCNEDQYYMDYMSNGLFGAVPGHPAIGGAVSRALTINFVDSAKRYGNPTGPKFFRKSFDIDTVCVLPSRTFYPIGYTEHSQGQIFGIHRWANSWGFNS